MVPDKAGHVCMAKQGRLMQNVPWSDLRKLLPGPWVMTTDIELQDGDDDESDVLWEREREPDPDEPMSHVGQVYEKEPAPRWTTREPQWPGHYWCRLPGGLTRVVCVYLDGRELRLNWTDITDQPVKGSGFEFSDRALPMPVEPR